MVKLAVIGSRGFNDYNLLKSVLEPVKNQISLIISGGAKGADTLAERFANENNIETLIFIPDWSKGKRAGYERNKQIVEACDIIITFWDGKSKGTQHSFKLAEKYNKRIKIIKYNGL